MQSLWAARLQHLDKSAGRISCSTHETVRSPRTVGLCRSATLVSERLQWAPDRSDIHYEDDALDRELNALVREIEQEEIIRRAVIDMLVMLGSDAMLEHDV